MSEPPVFYRPDYRTRWPRPLVLCPVSAGFPSPAEDWIECRLDLNRDLIKRLLSAKWRDLSKSPPLRSSPK